MSHSRARLTLRARSAKVQPNTSITSSASIGAKRLRPRCRQATIANARCPRQAMVLRTSWVVTAPSIGSLARRAQAAHRVHGEGLAERELYGVVGDRAARDAALRASQRKRHVQP